MNIFLLVVAFFSLLAVIAHVFGGTKQTASIASDENNILLTRSWKQIMCAFQKLAIDLINVTIALFTISLTDLLSFEYELTLFLSLLYLLWGVVCLVLGYC